MSGLRYSVDISAPKEIVWDVMLADITYRDWTSAFHEGSSYEGSWEKGSSIRFVAPDDGKVGGMFSRVVENIPYVYVELEHLGEIRDGVEDTSSESARQWAGARESYRLGEDDGTTTLVVELQGAEISPEFRDMFEQMWPQALQRLKEIAESRAASERSAGAVGG